MTLIQIVIDKILYTFIPIFCRLIIGQQNYKLENHYLCKQLWLLWF